MCVWYSGTKVSGAEKKTNSSTVDNNVDTDDAADENKRKSRHFSHVHCTTASGLE